jgi:hypothetical protein
MASSSKWTALLDKYRKSMAPPVAIFSAVKARLKPPRRALRCGLVSHALIF